MHPFQLAHLLAAPLAVLVGAATALGEPSWISYGLVARVAAAALLVQAGSQGLLAHARQPSGRLAPPRGTVDPVANPLWWAPAGAALLALGAWIGLAAVQARGWPMFWVGGAAVATGLAYSRGPALRDRGLGEPVSFLLFGPLPVLAGSLAAGGSLSSLALAASIPLGLLGTVAALAASRRDLERDRARQATSWATEFSPRAAERLFLALVATAYAWVALGALRGLFPWAALAVLLTVPWAGSALAAFRAGRDGGPVCQAAVQRAVALYLVFSAIYLAAWLLAVRLWPAAV